MYSANKTENRRDRNWPTAVPISDTAAAVCSQLRFCPMFVDIMPLNQNACSLFPMQQNSGAELLAGWRFHDSDCGGVNSTLARNNHLRRTAPTTDMKKKTTPLRP